MDVIIDNLSSLNSPELSSNLLGITFKQIRRYYPGDYVINFPLGLSGSNDFAVKNYSNFFLTNKFKLSDILNIENEKLKANNITTMIKFGSDLLKFDYINSNYGNALFTSTSSDSFNIKLLDNNRCQIYFTLNYKKYYLVCDSDNLIFFVKGKYLSFDESTINPQDFTYLFSEDGKNILLFKDTPSGFRFVTNNGGRMVTLPIIDDNVTSYVAQPLTIERNIYYTPNQNLDLSFITYNNDNTLDLTKSIFDLKNNFLFHKKYSTSGYTDIMVLKNQLLQPDVFSSANNLLSGSNGELFVDNLREYTSIFSDIKEETANEIELNYVFYNTTYKIKPGYNTFVSPSSMYPFRQLNINDSKFISSGAFSYNTPEYADKVYRISNVTQNANNGQYLLCTWLSGSPRSDNKVWVDRYYYPDLINKEEALAASSLILPTYDNYIEQLIQANANLRSEVVAYKVFDKISDMIFEPNQTYQYVRVSSSDIPTLSSTITYCNSYLANYPMNYFKNINKSGKFTFGIYFQGDYREWSVYSDRNAIDSGLTINKTATTVQITYKVFDPSDSITYTYYVEGNVKPIKENFISVSVDSLAGKGYVFLNNDVILSFSIPKFQFTIKQLLYGDFFFSQGSYKENILNYEGLVYNPYITETYIDPDLSFILPLVLNDRNIDDIYITLPCGMRNSSDNIAYLQNICESSAFKSNNINIIVKNLNITNDNILNGVRESILTTIEDFVPLNSKVNNITFENYK